LLLFIELFLKDCGRGTREPRNRHHSGEGDLPAIENYEPKNVEK
jgi:hypothetical protein